MTGSHAAEPEAPQGATAPFPSIKATADFLAGKLVNVNPASLVHISTCPKLTLYQNTPSGGKAWVAHALEEGLNIQWGKCSTRGQQRFIPINQCTGNSSVKELLKRTVDKLRKGYIVLLGESRFP